MVECKKKRTVENSTLPAFAKSKVGSSCGTTGLEATTVWSLESKKEQNVSRTRTAVHSSSPCVILERKEERKLKPKPSPPIPHPKKKNNTTQHNPTQYNTTQGERFKPQKNPKKTRNKTTNLRGEMRRERSQRKCAARMQTLKRNPKGRKEKRVDLWISWNIPLDMAKNNKK